MNEVEKLKARLVNTKRLNQKVVQLTIPEIEAIIKDFDDIKINHAKNVELLNKKIEEVRNEKPVATKVIVDVDQGMFKEKK